MVTLTDRHCISCGGPGDTDPDGARTCLLCGKIEYNRERVKALKAERQARKEEKQVTITAESTTKPTDKVGVPAVPASRPGETVEEYFREHASAILKDRDEIGAEATKTKWGIGTVGLVRLMQEALVARVSADVNRESKQETPVKRKSSGGALMKRADLFARMRWYEEHRGEITEYCWRYGQEETRKHFEIPVSTWRKYARKWRLSYAPTVNNNNAAPSEAALEEADSVTRRLQAELELVKAVNDALQKELCATKDNMARMATALNALVDSNHKAAAGLQETCLLTEFPPPDEFVGTSECVTRMWLDAYLELAFLWMGVNRQKRMEGKQ